MTPISFCILPDVSFAVRSRNKSITFQHHHRQEQFNHRWNWEHAQKHVTTLVTIDSNRRNINRVNINWPNINRTNINRLNINGNTMRLTNNKVKDAESIHNGFIIPKEISTNNNTSNNTNEAKWKQTQLQK